MAKPLLEPDTLARNVFLLLVAGVLAIMVTIPMVLLAMGVDR